MCLRRVEIQKKLRYVTANACILLLYERWAIQGSTNIWRRCVLKMVNDDNVRVVFHLVLLQN